VRISLLISIVLAQTIASSVRADGGADLAANSAIIRRVEEDLKPLGMGRLHVFGGAALSLAMAARHGTRPAWGDLDLGAFPRRDLDPRSMDTIARALGRDGFAEVIPPAPLHFVVHHRRLPENLHSHGYGLRLRTKDGLRFDVAVLRRPDTIVQSGYNSAESLYLPLRGQTDLGEVMSRLGRGPVRAVALRGDLIEPHGLVRDVLSGKVVLTNRYLVPVEPELAALRYLRAVEKMARYPVPLDAPDLRWLEQNLPMFLAQAPPIVDRTYGPRVQRQAAALLGTGPPHLLAAARKMGLDVRDLALGHLVRQRDQRSRSAAGARR
jgi:hypothetical protein